MMCLCAVDVRRLALAGGGGVTVVVRSGEPYLLKVELPSILPSHSRDVLETIRRVRELHAMCISSFLSYKESHPTILNTFYLHVQ
jgi:hypothetical protein